MSISSIGSTDLLTTMLSGMSGTSSNDINTEDFGQLLSSMMQTKLGSLGDFSDSASGSDAMQMMSMSGLSGLGSSSSSENILLMMMMMQMMQKQNSEESSNETATTSPSANVTAISQTGDQTTVSGNVSQASAGEDAETAETATSGAPSSALEKASTLKTDTYAKVQAYRDFASGISGSIRNIISSRIDRLT